MHLQNIFVSPIVYQFKLVLQGYLGWKFYDNLNKLTFSMYFKTKLFSTKRTLSAHTSISEPLTISGSRDFPRLKYLRDATYFINNSDILWQSFSIWRPHPLKVILELEKRWFE